MKYIFDIKIMIRRVCSLREKCLDVKKINEINLKMLL